MIEEHNYWITEARKRTYGSQKGRSAFYYQLPLRTREQATDALRRLKAQIEPMAERHSKEMGVKLCVVCYKAMFSRRGVCDVKGWVYLLPGLPAVVAGKSLSHHHVKYHHQDEADGETDGAEIGVLSLAGFRNQFFDNDVEHGSCCKGQHVGQNGR